MIQLPKFHPDPKETDYLCNHRMITTRTDSLMYTPKNESAQSTANDIHPTRCRPVCKHRRRKWKGVEQKTSAELLIERKPLPDCFRRWPMKIYPNSPCPLFGRTRQVTINERGAIHTPDVVRICQAPLDDFVHTPYLRYIQMASRLGALNAVHTCCPFCTCVGCCLCPNSGYALQDADRAGNRRRDMRSFDARTKCNCEPMKIMYM